MPDDTGGRRRARPRLWHHDYLHLRPLSRDLERSIATARRERSFRAILDVGSGDAPYREWLGDDASRYVRLDCDAAKTPSAVGLAEALPFRDGTFDAVLLTQVWGLWTDQRFVFSTGPATKKARNLAENPRAVLHLESGAQVVVLECRGREVTSVDVLEAFRIGYNAKYDWDFTPEQLSGGGVYELLPTTAFAWCGDHGEAFSGTATRWTFGQTHE